MHTKELASVQALSAHTPAVLRAHFPVAYCGLPAAQAVKATAPPPVQRQAHLQATSPPQLAGDDAKQATESSFWSPIQQPLAALQRLLTTVLLAALSTCASFPPAARPAQVVWAAAKFRGPS